MPPAGAREEHLITWEGAPARLEGFRRVLDEDNIMAVHLEELDQKVQGVARVAHVQLQDPKS